MENIDLQVGDMITYEIVEDNVFKVLKRIIVDEYDIAVIKINNYRILKIERPKYEVIKEKKELLTEEEKEFLHDILKHYEITYIRFDSYVKAFKEGGYVAVSTDYPRDLKFEGIERYKDYTLKELGLE